MPKIIRDFIYVDSEYLHSLYSQVFEGIAEQIIQSHLSGETRGQSLRTEDDATKKSQEQEAVQSSLRTENRILLDHIYNKLEEKISPSFPDVKQISQGNYDEQLKGTFLIKVRGKAEIEDYERVKDFTKSFNKMGEAIAYAKVSSIPDSRLILAKKEMIAKVTEQIKSTPSNERQNLQSFLTRLKALPEPEAFVKSVQEEDGLLLDQKLLDHYAEWFERYYPNGFEITLVPEVENSNVVYRGVVDKKFLRLSPDSLRSLFGNFVDAEWVMVGQVTYAPNFRKPKSEDVDKALKIEAEENITDESEAIDHLVENLQAPDKQKNDMTLRDPIRSLIKNAASFDKMFFESEERTELLVRPLAIYREFSLAI